MEMCVIMATAGKQNNYIYVPQNNPLESIDRKGRKEFRSEYDN